MGATNKVRRQKEIRDTPFLRPSSSVQNKPRPNLNMVIKSPHSTSYFITIVMFDSSFTILEIFAVDVLMTMSVTFIIGHGR